MKLATARLVLRDPEPADARALAAYQSDARYLAHYTEPPDADAIIATACRWAAESPRRNHQFVVTLGDAVIGCAGVREAGDLGIELDPRHWGKGYAREALTALIAFARDELGIARLTASTAATNARAHRLVEALGFHPLPADGPEVLFQLNMRVNGE